MIGIIGAGLIGKKRALNLCDQKLVAVADLDFTRAQELAGPFSAKATARWQDVTENPVITTVIVCTSNNVIPECAEAAIRAGKHVLVEKPGGVLSSQLTQLARLSQEQNRVLCVGFNHRFHPALLEAKKIAESGEFGPLMYIRARYGHGGRIGYDKEWRANPALSGGGELLDQGVHLIDLCRWIGGDFEFEYGRVETYFWDMPVEDNGFLLLRSKQGKARAFLHASCTEWKNLFDFEIFYRNAKVQIFGLGRSYGVEELRIYKMKPEMGPPDLITKKFDGEDLSWSFEFDAFLNEVQGKNTFIGKAADGAAALAIVEKSYAASGVTWR